MHGIDFLLMPTRSSCCIRENNITTIIDSETLTLPIIHTISNSTNHADTMMKRAARRRKRNKPPGPCGVLWEMSKSKVPMLEEEELTHETKVLFSEESTNEATNKKKRTEEQYDRSMPAAWQAMQRSLDITTPYLPLHTRGNLQKRYELLRPHLPKNCILLPEILNGSHDLKMIHSDKYLCVWVDAVEERNSHHGIWTVELTDETGATIRAWMEPNFVKEELQKAQKGDGVGIVRIGVVWMLSDLSMIAINNTNSNNSNEVERMLVVSGKRILKVWTPESDRAQNQPLEEEDSPEAQRKYLDWMEKRNALTVDESHVDNNGNDDEAEDEIDEEVHGDRCHRNPSRQQEAKMRQSDEKEEDDDSRRIVGGKEQQERMTELSALTMTADDENLIATSAHDRYDAIPRLAHTTSPLVDRNMNRIHLSRTSAYNNSNDDNLLQTQESAAPLKNKLDANSDKQLHRHPSGNLHNDQLLTQPNPSHKNSDCNSQRNSSDHKIVFSQGLSPLKRKKCKKKKDSSPIPNRTKSTKRSKRNRTCSSPIRMSKSVWNTPDPSILEMLEDSNDNADEEEEVLTVIGEETSLSFNPTTQSTNRIQTETNLPANAENSTQPDIKDCAKEKLIGDEPLLLAGRALLGWNLFEPSNWKGVDSTAFSESDSE